MIKMGSVWLQADMSTSFFSFGHENVFEIFRKIRQIQWTTTNLTTRWNHVNASFSKDFGFLEKNLNLSEDILESVYQEMFELEDFALRENPWSKYGIEACWKNLESGAKRTDELELLQML